MMSDESSEPYAALVETHTAVVFFVGDRAYKLKKPVEFGFLDFLIRRRRIALEPTRRQLGEPSRDVGREPHALVADQPRTRELPVAHPLPQRWIGHVDDGQHFGPRQQPNAERLAGRS